MNEEKREIIEKLEVGTTYSGVDVICRQYKEIERLNNKLKLINTIVEREFPPNEFITYKMKKILKGSDKE